MSKQLLQSYPLGSVSVLYFIESESQIVGFTIIPHLLEEKFTLNGNWDIESLVQLKAVGDEYPTGYTNGYSMRNSETCQTLKFEKQVNTMDGDETKIITTVSSKRLRATHIVSFCKGEEGIHVQTTLENIGNVSMKIEMLSSFSLCNIFSFECDVWSNHYKVHRTRTVCGQEGQLETQIMNELLREPSCQKCGVQSIRYGQVGTMPVRDYVPWLVLEDSKNHCFIGATIAWAGSWQLEVFREDDRLSVSGGLADREFGHWMKELYPGEVLMTPDTFLTACIGRFDHICNKLVSRSKNLWNKIPDCEQTMPIVFNEFCTTEGKSSEEKIYEMAAALKGKGITYFVIDAGWSGNSSKEWEQGIGDWIVNSVKFPNGLKRAADIIKECGMHPGIQFEIETIGKDAAVYQKVDWQLQRDEYPISTEKRRFFDLRNPQVVTYLKQKIITTIQECGFEYLKVDYPDTIGIGCDGNESPGEGLRQQVLASAQLYKDIKNECPGLVMENASPNGHRLEPSLMDHFQLASCSGAYECISIPLIAANVHRYIQPGQSLIWAVLRKEDSLQRIGYTMTSTLLGGMCLSGDIFDLNTLQWNLIHKSIAFYKRVSDIVKYGESFRYVSSIISYVKPNGYQILVRTYGNKMLIIVHNFLQEEHEKNVSSNMIVEDILELKKVDIIEILSVNPVQVTISEMKLCIKGLKELDSCAILAENKIN